MRYLNSQQALVVKNYRQIDSRDSNVKTLLTNLAAFFKSLEVINLQINPRIQMWCLIKDKVMQEVKEQEQGNTNLSKWFVQPKVVLELFHKAFYKAREDNFGHYVPVHRGIWRNSHQSLRPSPAFWLGGKVRDRVCEIELYEWVQVLVMIKLNWSLCGIMMTNDLRNLEEWKVDGMVDDFENWVFVRHNLVKISVVILVSGLILLVLILIKKWIWFDFNLTFHSFISSNFVLCQDVSKNSIKLTFNNL